METVRTRLLTALAAAGLIAAACAGGVTITPAPTPAPTPPPTAPPTPAATPAPTPTASEPMDHEGEVIAFDAASATITVDGDNADWSAVEGATITLEQLRLEGIDPSQAAEIEFGPVDPIDVTLKVASDDENIYLLLEVPDDFDYDADDHNRSPSVAVMFRVDEPAAPHMGAEEPDIDQGLGVVDIWHWELDCAAGETSGGQSLVGGDDPECNLDDEWSTKPENREDDGGGDVENANADNSLTGVWEHTARASGAGAQGTWIFEFSRPLQTGDPQDGQFGSGITAHVALAYFDPDEGADGWTDAGHLQSAYNGWIEVTLK